MLRKNALLLPAVPDLTLSLALIESSHGRNHHEALALVRHAMTIDPSSTTALATMATVASSAGRTMPTLLALCALRVPTAEHDMAVAAVWPAGVPPHEAVTDPEERFWDSDVAERAECAVDAVGKVGNSATFRDAAAMPTTLLRGPAYLRSIAYESLLALAQARGWAALMHNVRRLASKHGVPARDTNPKLKPTRHRPLHGAGNAPSPEAAEALLPPLQVCDEALSPRDAKLAGTLSAASLASGYSASASQRVERSAGTSAVSDKSAHEPSIAYFKHRGEQPSPDLWQTVFGGQAAQQQCDAVTPVAADLSHLPDPLRHSPRQWHPHEPEGPVAECPRRPVKGPLSNSYAEAGCQRELLSLESPAQLACACAHGDRAQSAPAPSGRGSCAQSAPVYLSARRSAACAEVVEGCVRGGDTLRSHDAEGEQPVRAVSLAAHRVAADVSPILQLQRALHALQRGASSITSQQLAVLQVRAQEYSASLTSEPPPRPISRTAVCQSAAESVMPVAGHADDAAMLCDWPAGCAGAVQGLPDLQHGNRSPPDVTQSSEGDRRSRCKGVQGVVANQLLRPEAAAYRVRKLRQRAIGRSAGTARHVEILVRACIVDCAADASWSSCISLWVFSIHCYKVRACCTQWTLRSMFSVRAVQYVEYNDPGVRLGCMAEAGFVCGLVKLQERL